MTRKSHVQKYNLKKLKKSCTNIVHYRETGPSNNLLLIYIIDSAMSIWTYRGDDVIFSLRCSIYVWPKKSCADPGSFSFSLCGRIHANISGPSSALQWNAIKMAFRRRADNDPTLNSGFVACTWLFRVSGPVLLWTPKFLWFFRGSRPHTPPPPPPMDPCMGSRALNALHTVTPKCVLSVAKWNVA